MPSQNSIGTDLKKINQELYKHSLELAVINKTLSLLRKLYQISLQALHPDQLAQKISQTILTDLNMEMVGIYALDEKSHQLKAFPFAKSARLAGALAEADFKFSELSLDVSDTSLIPHSVVHNRRPGMTTGLADVWGDQISSELIKEITTASNLKTLLLFPLDTRGEVIGQLLLGLNRSYNTLNEFEREAIKSCVDVVSVALDKVLLYQELSDANEQLKALDKARAEFITIASHQLRTPPATIKWYLSAIAGGDFGKMDPAVEEAVSKVMATNDAQISTISDLLNASRIERGKLEFFFEEADFEHLASESVNQLKPLAEMKKLQLSYQPSQSALPSIVMDQEKIRQVMNNMIDNAIKYTKQGDIKVKVEQVDGNVKFSVSDQGKGLSKEEAAKLFQKFTRGDNSATHATGLGLGMYVAKVIVDQHNGKIWAESEGRDKGSTFAFSIPLNNSLKATTVDLTKIQE